jgi:hypothetical protein
VPLQNRVTPFGELIASPARGTLMGNRGRLHDAARRIVRRTAPGYRAWVICRLAFRARRRAVMTPGRYTELFFLDEATALAAGHRPCGECRRTDHLRYKRAWLAGNPQHGLPAGAPIGAIDRVLHGERLGAAGRRPTFAANLEELPDGVFVILPETGEPCLIWQRAVHPWSPAGYGPLRSRPGSLTVTVLTPPSTVGAIAVGYVPAVHPSVATLPDPSEALAVRAGLG